MRCWIRFRNGRREGNLEIGQDVADSIGEDNNLTCMIHV